MPNVFDQFDAQSSPAQGGNVFDQFDAPKPDTSKLPWYARTMLSLADKGVLGNVADVGNAAVSGAGNVISDIGQSAATRTGEAAQSERDYQAGKISLPVALFQQGGKLVGGMAGDALGSVIKNFAPDAVTSGLQRGAQAVSDKIDPVAPEVGNTALQASNAVGQFAKDNPQTWKTLEAGGDLLNIPPAMAALKAASPAVGAVGDTLSATGQAIGQAADARSVASQITPQMIKDAKTAKYTAMRQNGAVIGQNGNDLILNTINSSLKDVGGLDPVRQGGTASVLQQIKDAAKAGDIDLEKMDAFRQQLNEVIGDNKISKIDGGGFKSDGMKAQVVKNALDKSVDALNESHLTAGTPEAITALNEGRGLYSAQRKIELINNLVEDAKLTRNPATAIKTGMRNLYKQARAYGSGWTDEEKAALKYGADTGIVGGAVNLLGSRIIAGIGGAAAGSAAGPLGALAGTAVAEGLTYPMNKLSTAMQANRANKAADLVVNRPIVQKLAQDAMQSGGLSPKFTALKALGVTMDKAGQLLRGGKPFTMREVMQLPPIAARPVLEEMKLLAAPDKMSPLPMSDAEIMRAQKQMQQPPISGDDTSGAAIRPPVSQRLKVEENADWITGKQYKNMESALLNGDISQNAFVEKAQKAFGLNTTQARALAKEIKTYSK